MNLLVIVDMQFDFLYGALKCTEPHKPVDLVDGINRLIHSGRYDKIVATADWHPENHSSFQKWPAHCVVGTPGVQLSIDEDAVDIIFRKGRRVNVDEYASLDLQAYVRALAQKQLVLADVVGIAFEYCVAYTAEALLPYADVTVYPRFSNYVKQEDAVEAVLRLKEKGVTVDEA